MIEINIKEELGRSIGRALEWIKNSLDENDQYIEFVLEKEYLPENLSKNYTMVDAERIMLLNNVYEWKESYPSFNKMLTEIDFEKLFSNFIEKLNKKNAFAGMPYIWLKEDYRDNVMFTDNVNYVLGALCSTIKLGRLKNKELLDNAYKHLLKCTNELIEGSVEYEHENSDKIMKVSGWAWCLRNREVGSDFCPIQTCFTASAFITLLEILFEVPDLTDEYKIERERIFNLLNDVKETIIFISKEHGDAVNWNDFDPIGEINKDFAPSNYENLDFGSEQHSLLYLEALSYIKYYEKYENEFTKLVWEKHLKGCDTQSFTNLTEGEDYRVSDERKKITVVLNSSYSLWKSSKEKVLTPTISSLPKEYVLNKSYNDGGTIYNLINSVNFGMNYIPSANQKFRTDWNESGKVDLLKSIIDSVFIENNFVHIEKYTDNFSNVKYPAIYATRAAIACFISADLVMEPATTVHFTNEIENIISKLNKLKGGFKYQPINVSEDEHYEDLTELFFLLGVLSAAYISATYNPSKSSNKEFMTDFAGKKMGKDAMVASFNNIYYALRAGLKQPDGPMEKEIADIGLPGPIKEKLIDIKLDNEDVGSRIKKLLNITKENLTVFSEGTGQVEIKDII